jgi:hypothetical protein
MEHKEWYSQRYGKARSAEETAAYAAKLDNWAAQKEAAKEASQQRLEGAPTVFAEHGIEYQVKGTYWLCKVQGTEYKYYPKSGKFRPVGGNTTYCSRGALDFLGKVAQYKRSRC